MMSLIKETALFGEVLLLLLMQCDSEDRVWKKSGQILLWRQK